MLIVVFWEDCMGTTVIIIDSLFVNSVEWTFLICWTVKTAEGWISSKVREKA
jgi:hypothetical protein